jgi:hypothetical protein
MYTDTFIPFFSQKACLITLSRLSLSISLLCSLLKKERSLSRKFSINQMTELMDKFSPIVRLSCSKLDNFKMVNGTLPLENFYCRCLHVRNQGGHTTIWEKISTSQKLLLVIPVNDIIILLYKMTKMNTFREGNKKILQVTEVFTRTKM